MSSKTLKQIAISEENYQILKTYGQAGDSYNDALTRLIKESVKNAV